MRLRNARSDGPKETLACHIPIVPAVLGTRALSRNILPLFVALTIAFSLALSQGFAAPEATNECPVRRRADVAVPVCEGGATRGSRGN